MATLHLWQDQLPRLMFTVTWKLRKLSVLRLCMRSFRNFQIVDTIGLRALHHVLAPQLFITEAIAGLVYVY